MLRHFVLGKVKNTISICRGNELYAPLTQRSSEICMFIHFISGVAITEMPVLIIIYMVLVEYICCTKNTQSQQCFLACEIPVVIDEGWYTLSCLPVHDKLLQKGKTMGWFMMEVYPVFVIVLETSIRSILLYHYIGPTQT